MKVLDDDGRRQVDQQLKEWRQGDCVVGEQWFLFRTDVARPLTDAGATAAEEEAEDAAVLTLGFAVVTQTCDLVRSCGDRPFVEVCPLVEVDESVLREVERGRRPNYAFIPGVSNQRVVADLERVMTVEKPVVAGWERVQGCLDDADHRRLSLALARKRARTAFPDDFVAFASPLMKRMSSKHDKESDEGRALRALREVRVRAAPSWDATEVSVMFWFIRDEDESTFEDIGWEHYLDDWLKRVTTKGRFVEVEGLVTTLDDLTAREYVESDALDLDYLSSRED